MYPTLGISAADAVAIRIKKAMDDGLNQDIYCDVGFEGLHTEFVRQRQSEGVDVSEDELYYIAHEIYLDASYGGVSIYELEQNHAELLHKHLSQLPTQALQDPNFWRYLALFPFRRYLTVRERDLTPIRYGGGSGGSKAYWLLPRTFIWGRKCFDSKAQSYELVHEMLEQRLKNGLSAGTVIDFYHSHIVRTAWSADSRISLDFLAGVFSEPILFDKDNKASRPTNVLSSSIARLSNNVLLEVADNSVAEEIYKTKMYILASEQSGNSELKEEET